MTDALIGMGSNLGDPQKNLHDAVRLLRATPGVENIAASRSLATAPIGGPAGQSDFLNAACRATTSLSPLELLDALRGIESQLGRTRGVRWGSRTIDLDLLLYGDDVIDTPRLTVPHPRLAVRKFALLPASEVAGEMRHPQMGWTIDELLDHVLHAPPYFAVIGRNHALVTQIARDAAAAVGGRLIHGPRLEVAASHAERLEFLTRAAQAAPAAEEMRSGRPIISDFWIGEALCDQAEGVDDSLRRAFAASSQTTVSPKMLAVVDQPVAAIPRSLLAGPTLRLPAEPAEAATELVAVIAAMQS